MSKVTCPECGAEFEVEVRPAAPQAEPRRRWARWALLVLAVACALAWAGACWGGRL